MIKSHDFFYIFDPATICSFTLFHSSIFVTQWNVACHSFHWILQFFWLDSIHLFSMKDNCLIMDKTSSLSSYSFISRTISPVNMNGMMGSSVMGKTSISSMPLSNVIVQETVTEFENCCQQRALANQNTLERLLRDSNEEKETENCSNIEKESQEVLQESHCGQVEPLVSEPVLENTEFSHSSENTLKENPSRHLHSPKHPPLLHRLNLLHDPDTLQKWLKHLKAHKKSMPKRKCKKRPQGNLFQKMLKWLDHHTPIEAKSIVGPWTLIKVAGLLAFCSVSSLVIVKTG